METPLTSDAGPVSGTANPSNDERTLSKSCGLCPVPCSLASAGHDEGPQGWSFVWRVFLALVLPCLMLIGTVVALSGKIGELAAAVCGLLVCLSVAADVSRVLRGCPAGSKQAS